MEIDRRTFLTLLAGGLLGSVVPIRTWGSAPGRLYLSARADQDRAFHVNGFDGMGTMVFDLPLPARGHSLTVHPRRHQAVIFARRPGTFAQVIDLTQGAVVITIEPPEDRHFYGHGVFASDGRLLYATENDYAGYRGVIGIYDTLDGYRRLGELPSQGIGPHDIRLLNDGTTLVIANGGILTHPDLPRIKLNLPTMAPSLVYLDRRDGRLLGEFQLAPELHQLSIRHLAVGPDNTVAIAIQDQGPQGNLAPLVGLHRQGENIMLCRAPDKVWQRMRQYCGSVAFDSSGTVFAVSSPRGNLITCWKTNSGQYLSSTEITDGCGVASGIRPFEFLVSSGVGGVFTIDARSGKRRPIISPFLNDGHWDNHLVEAG